jgi:hypothetical protein
MAARVAAAAASASARAFAALTAGSSTVRALTVDATASKGCAPRWRLPAARPDAEPCGSRAT